MNREVKGAEGGRVGEENTDRSRWKWDEGGRKGREAESKGQEGGKVEEVQFNHLSYSYSPGSEETSVLLTL